MQIIKVVLAVVVLYAIGVFLNACNRTKTIEGGTVRSLIGKDHHGSVVAFENSPLIVAVSWVACRHCRTLRTEWDAVKRPADVRMLWLEYDHDKGTADPQNQAVEYLKELGLHEDRFPDVLYWQRDATRFEKYRGVRGLDKLVESLSLL